MDDSQLPVNLILTLLIELCFPETKIDPTFQAQIKVEPIRPGKAVTSPPETQEFGLDLKRDANQDRARFVR